MIFTVAGFALLIGLALGLVGYSDAENRAFRRFLAAHQRTVAARNRHPAGFLRAAEDCQ